MNRLLPLLAAGLTLTITGCSAPAEESPTTGTTASTTAEPTQAVTIGMDMVEVKKLKGAPEESKHEHGEGGAELDIWIYKDATITFENEKVKKID